MIKNHCPGKVSKLNSSTELHYCHSTYDHNIAGTKISTTWNVDADIQSSKLTTIPGCSPSTLGSGDEARINAGNCQPTSCLFYQDNKAQVCAQLNRGTDSNDPSTFYSNPSTYDPTVTDQKWQFNPYSAFVHMICGQKIYAFPTDD